MRKMLSIIAVCSVVFLTGASSPNCQSGYFCVSDYPTPQDAMIAAGAAGGGRVWFSQNTLVSTTIVVPDNVLVECASRGVVVQTSSPTDDLFTLQGNNTGIENCGLRYSGGAIKTAGYLANITAMNAHMRNIDITGNCWVCIRSAGIVHTISQLVVNGTSSAVAPGSGAIETTSEVLQLSSVVIGSGDVNPYDFGVHILTGAVDSSGLEIIHTKKSLWISPGAGQTAFFKGTSGYLDNCMATCALLQPLSPLGTIGTATFVGYEFGSVKGATPVRIDTKSYGGNVGSVTISASEIFAYATSLTNGVDMFGPLGTIKLLGSIIGNNLNAGVVINSATNCNCIIANNDIRGIGAGFWGGSIVSNLRFGGNVMNGSAIVQGGNSVSSFYNN